MKSKPIIYKCIHAMLIKRAAPDGKIERRKLFEIIAERVGRIPEEDRGEIIKELQESGLILDSDKISFTISRSF